MSRNQLLQNAPKLPLSLRWKIKVLFLGNQNRLCFEDYDQIIFKQQKGDLWLVDLIRDGVLDSGLVGIVNKSKK